MKRERFNREKVKAGDRLVLTRFPAVELTFKFMGHGSDLIASWVYPEPGRPKDVILHQRDVMRVVE